MDSSKIKKFLLIVLIILGFVILVLGSWEYYLRFRSTTNENTIKDNWKTYDKRVDYVAIDGRLIRDENIAGGIRLLPIGYVEKNISYEIYSYTFEDNTERKHLLFESLPELTSVRLLPNSIDPSKLWVLTFRSNDCTKDALSSKDKTKYGDCSFMLYEFDFNTEKLTKKTNLGFYVNIPVESVYLLAHDAINNKVWLSLYHEISQSEVDYYSKYDPEKVDKRWKHYASGLVVYDANKNTSNVEDTPFFMSMVFRSIYGSVARTGADGELYFLGECTIKCLGSQSLKDGLYSTKSYALSPVNIFTFGIDIDDFRDTQIFVDDKNSYLYMVTKTFDQDKPSNIFGYDIKTGRSFHVGKQPTVSEDDDIRGLTVVDGNLLFGSFSGLYVYNRIKDEWKNLNESNGIKSNNIIGVHKINNDGVCLIHEKNGASCLFSSINKYINNLNSY